MGTRYVTVADVVHINESIVGPDHLRDFGLLESAVMRPQQTVGGRDAYPTIHAKNAALIHSLIRNHPFVDGNKRTAVLSAIVAYGLNGYLFIANDDDVIDLATEIAEGYASTEQVEGRLMSHVVVMPLKKEGEDAIVLPADEETSS